MTNGLKVTIGVAVGLEEKVRELQVNNDSLNIKGDHCNALLTIVVI